MQNYKNSFYTVFLLISLSVLFQGCFADKEQVAAFEKEEEKRLAKERFDEKHEEKFPTGFALATENGYQGYIEAKSIEKFISEYEYGRMDINEYKNYVIANKSGATYAYKFLKIINNTEVYEPDSKYGWVNAVGIKRSKGQRNTPVVGSPMRDTKLVSFLGMSNYKTRFGVHKKVLVFNRAERFRAVSK